MQAGELVEALRRLAAEERVIMALPIREQRQRRLVESTKQATLPNLLLCSSPTMPPSFQAVIPCDGGVNAGEFSRYEAYASAVERGSAS